MKRVVFVICLTACVLFAQEDPQEELRQILDEAITKYKEGHYKEAYEKFELALQKKPSSDLVYVWLKRTGEDVILSMLNIVTEKEDEKPYVEKIRDMGKRLFELSKPGEHAPIDKEEILKHIENLRSKDEQVIMYSTFHLWHAGPYGVKYLIPILKDTTDNILRARAIYVLTKIGTSITLALVEALDSPDKLMKQNAAIILGNIKDERSLPALKRLYEDPHLLPEVKESVQEAITKITGKDPANIKNATDLYYDLAEKYYYSDPSVIHAWDRSFLIWKWETQRDAVTERSVPSFAYNEQLAEECLLDLLEIDPAYENAWILLIMTHLSEYLEGLSAQDAAEQAASIGELSQDALNKLKEKMTGVDRTSVLASMIPKKFFCQALDRSLKDKNAALSQALIQILETILVESDLPPEQVDAKDKDKYIAYPVVEALTNDDKRVRYSAANCILKVSPQTKKLGWELVVPNIVDAIGETGTRVALVIYELRNQEDYDTINKLKKTMIQSGIFPVIAKNANEGLVKAAAFPTEDIIFIQYRLAGQVSTSVIFHGRILHNQSVFDALRDDVRTKNIPKYFICNSEEELQKAKEIFKEHAQQFLTPQIDKLELAKYIEETFGSEQAQQDAKNRANKIAKDAVESLAQLDINTTIYPYKDAISALSKACSPDELRPDFIRLPAIKAIGNLADLSGVDVLAKILADKPDDPEKVAMLKLLRLEAAVSLGKIFKRNKYTPTAETLEILKKILYDNDYDIESAIAQAIANADLTNEQRVELQKLKRLKRASYTADEIGK